MQGMHPLSERVRLVGRRSERLVVCYAISCFLTVVVATGFLLGMADYLVRYQDLGMRLIASTVLLTVVIVAYARYLRPAIKRRLTNLEVARRIEDRFPRLNGRLSSAISFLQQPNSGGSAELQHVVVDDAVRSIKDLDLMDCLDAQAPRRAAAGTVLLLVIVGAVCYPHRETVQLASQRMLMPWSQVSWPRWNSLSFYAPAQRIAAGDDFEVELIDLNGRLPEQVNIQYWFAGESQQQAVSRPMTRVGDRLVDRYSNVTRSFRYRAFGGDDDTMPWHLATVVEPPQIEELHIDVQPPAYSGQSPLASGRHIRALEGSQIRVSAKVNKRLARVAWKSDLVDEVFLDAPALAADGRTFVAPTEMPFLVRESGAFWFDFTDEDGIVRNEALRCELQVVADFPPAVVLESPSQNDLLYASGDRAAARASRR